ncbi:hypothetical protein [Brevibacillus parabrevis]|uniref:hypothetical protein n=1 Tax=Brevibacillus parabrevis TaxID=54914 RepID=UPI001E632E5E|nr:hypothetical protein [Brevibacillus parabrevis]
MEFPYRCKSFPCIILNNSGKYIQEELTFFGKLLGKEQEAKDWLADYEKRIAAAKERVHKVIPEGKSFSIIELTYKQMFDHFGKSEGPCRGPCQLCMGLFCFIFFLQSLQAVTLPVALVWRNVTWF